MPRRPLVYLVVFFAAVAALRPAGAAETVFPPGQRIGLVPPGDLKPSTRFPGFEDIDRKVTVTTLDLPPNTYGEIERALRTQNQRGLTEVKQEAFSFQGGAGTLLTARARLNDVDIHKWILLATAGVEKGLDMMIEVNVPDAALAAYPDATIRQALATVTFRPSPITEQLGMLPFKIGDLAGFRVVKVFPTGGVVMTEGPNDDVGNQPYLAIAIGGGAPEQTDDRALFARDMLVTVPLRDLRMQSAEAMRIGGAPGYEIRAQAVGPNNEPLSLVQWLRFRGGNFMRILGIGPKDQWDALFTRFRAVRDGIEPQ